MKQRPIPNGAKNFHIQGHKSPISPKSPFTSYRKSLVNSKSASSSNEYLILENEHQEIVLNKPQSTSKKSSIHIGLNLNQISQKITQSNRNLAFKEGTQSNGTLIPNKTSHEITRNVSQKQSIGENSDFIYQSFNLDLNMPPQPVHQIKLVVQPETEPDLDKLSQNNS